MRSILSTLFELCSLHLVGDSTMPSIALAYAGLPDIDDTLPLDDQDRACLDDIKKVLKAYGKLDRFGVNLLHSHFAIGPNETLLETCDPSARTLTMQVVDKERVNSQEIIETNWRLSDDATLLSCVRACVRRSATGRHESVHTKMR